MFIDKYSKKISPEIKAEFDKYKSFGDYYGNAKVTAKCCRIFHDTISPTKLKRRLKEEDGMEWTNFMKLWVYLGKKKEYGHVTRFYICKHLDRATGLCPIYHTGRPRVCTGFKSEANTCGNTCTSFKCKENIIKKSNVPKRIKDLNKRSLKMEIGINA